MPFPFEVPFQRVSENLDAFVDEVFGSLHSAFLTIPKGPGFVDFPTFDAGYEALKRETANFRAISPGALTRAVYETPVAFVVVRSILGFTPPEWAYETTERTPIRVDQGAARSIDKAMRAGGISPRSDRGNLTDQRIKAMLSAAVEILAEGVGDVDRHLILHRLDKIDTAEGVRNLEPVANLGVPYSVLLYERFLGRPFAAHRDAVSELVGDVVESAIETALSERGVSFRKTKRAERIAGFDQAPDFIIPNELNPAVIIEAKLTEDDGTARDKVARVQNLRALRDTEGKAYDIVACIAGRGFKCRREDMRRLLEATNGLVFTLETIDRLVDCTRIGQFAAK